MANDLPSPKPAVVLSSASGEASGGGRLQDAATAAASLQMLNPALTDFPDSISISLTLRPRREPYLEKLWIVHDYAAFERFLANADTPTLRCCRVAVVTDADGRRQALVDVSGERGTIALPNLPADGYAAHPGLPRLFIPAAYTLSPPIRRDRLAAALGLTDDGLIWLEPGPARGWRLHRVQAVCFRPTVELVRHVVPSASPLISAWSGDNPLAFNTIGPVIDPEPKEPIASLRRSTAKSWLTRLSEKFRRLPQQSPPPAAPLNPPSREPKVMPTVAVSPDWVARRVELAQRLLGELPRLSDTARAQLWAETATIAYDAGQYADAGLCWANAVWECAHPPREWFDAWLKAERLLAKHSQNLKSFNAWMSQNARRVSPRLAAAYLAWCATRSLVPSNLRQLVSLLETQVDALPVRSAWLARLAAAELADGDPLGVARYRDTIFRRLAEFGFRRDRDTPTFLRCYGQSGADRFSVARDWLIRMHDPVQQWLERQSTSRGLQAFGLDPETDATAGYVHLLFAWGAAHLGEQSVARHWEHSAIRRLGRRGGVHAVLLAAYRHRIRDALYGRPSKPGFPKDILGAYQQLTDFQRYAVDQVRRASVILEPLDRVNPYRGRDTATLFGTDTLGARLRRLGDRSNDDELTDEVHSLLAHAASDSDLHTHPRILLAVLAVAPRLPIETALDLLAQVPAALRVAPESLWASRSRNLSPLQLEEYLTALLDAALHAAVVWNAPEMARELIRALTGPTAPPAPIPQIVVGSIAGSLFRTLRRLGLQAETQTVLEQICPVATDPAVRAGLAVGWFTLGHVTVAMEHLDEVRRDLFADRSTLPRQRLKLAVAYAAALGHAPPAQALARLEELLHRLDIAWVHGSANRYVTVSLIEIVDTILRAVVSDDFLLSPVVRDWLDDLEFTTRRRIARNLDSMLATANFSADDDNHRPLRNK